MKKIGLKKSRLFERTFEVLKIGIFWGLSQCDVCDGVIYMSNKSKYLKTEMRYATAAKTNLYNFKSSFK